MHAMRTEPRVQHRRCCSCSPCALLVLDIRSAFLVETAAGPPRLCESRCTPWFRGSRVGYRSALLLVDHYLNDTGPSTLAFFLGDNLWSNASHRNQKSWPD
jgi:hypothetical protein